MVIVHKQEESQWRRSREGAWIEIDNINKTLHCLNVAPVRERGLKLQG